MIEFSVLGIKVRIKFIFVALVTIFLLVDKTGISVMALLACIIHELGHLIMFTAVGSKPQTLSFELAGIKLTKTNTSLSYTREVLVQLAGSTANFIVFASMYSYTNEISKAGIFAVTHLIIGVFNLLPLKSFDGGKLLELFFLKICTMRTTALICTIVDFFCISVLLIASLYAFFFNTNSFTLVILSAYLMISAIVKMGRSAVPSASSSLRSRRG